MTLYLVIFVSTAINDFLLAYGKITGVYLTQYGFFFLLFGQIILIAARNRNIRTQNEKLNFNLKREFKEKKELLVTKEDLEASIQKIKSELQKAEKQLIQADKMSTLGTLMAGLSHEINNPMQFIDSNRYLIEEELKSVKDLSKNDAPKNGKSLNYSLDSIQNRMEKIQIGVRKITELNRSMMNLSRLDDQVQSKEKIIDILKETLLILDFKLKNHEVMIDVNENIFIRCHRGQVGQVFMNLLSNAADAISEKTNKKGKIQIIGYVEANQFTICIEDSGVGFSEKIKEKVFEGFFTTKGIERGTGLGLSITRKIMDIHKGKIQLDKSIALGGAKVLVSFPIEE
jgi:signal transduction histidine kinase